MKKIIIASAIVCAAVVSQAAAVSWDTDVNYFNGNGGSASLNTDGSVKLGKDAMTAYLWILDDATAYNAALAKITAQDGTTASWAKDYIAAGGWDATKNTAKAGTISLTDGKAYSDGDTVYGLIIAKTTQDGKDYFYANVAQADVGQLDRSVQHLNANLGGTGTGATATAIMWNAAAAVPEPTSGLLLLLGMAGLALRRRA